MAVTDFGKKVTQLLEKITQQPREENPQILHLTSWLRQAHPPPSPLVLVL